MTKLLPGLVLVLTVPVHAVAAGAGNAHDPVDTLLAQALRIKAEAGEQTGDPMAVIRAFRAVVKRAPRNREARQHLAEIGWDLAREVEEAEILDETARAAETAAIIRNHLFDIVWRTEHFAKKNREEAVFAAAVFYRQGILAEADQTRACDYYGQAAGGGNSRAAFRQAQCLLESDPGLAERLFWRTAEDGHPQAQHLVAQGLLGETKGDNLVAVSLLRRSADQGRASAQALLAWILRHGAPGVDSDPRQALGYYRKSADAGYAAAQNNLGEIHESGTLTEKDLDEAVRWYEAAVKQGFPPAEVNLARVLVVDESHRDLCRAESLIQGAVNSGFEPARQVADWMRETRMTCAH